MSYEKLVEKIRKYTEKSVKKSRYEHSVRVAEMCVKICAHYGFDEKKGYLVGIAHDMCKDLSSSKMMEIAQRDGNPISDAETNKPSLLHGRAAAVTMKEKFGITDEDELEAVAVHTTGKIGMCTLAKVLFLADKIEPGRPQTNEQYYSKLFSLDFDEMFLSVLQENADYLLSKGIATTPEDSEVLNYYRSKRAESKN